MRSQCPAGPADGELGFCSSAPVGAGELASSSLYPKGTRFAASAGPARGELWVDSFASVDVFELVPSSPSAGPALFMKFLVIGHLRPFRLGSLEPSTGLFQIF